MVEWIRQLTSPHQVRAAALASAGSGEVWAETDVRGEAYVFCGGDHHVCHHRAFRQPLRSSSGTLGLPPMVSKQSARSAW
jgi:hypothetical protein